MECQHINIESNFNPQLIITKLKKSADEDWYCSKCRLETDSTWLCLSCGVISCGRFEKGHAQQHNNNFGHCIALDLITKSCHCYGCDDYVQGINDERESELDNIRKVVNKINAGITVEPVVVRPKRREKFNGISGLKNLGNTCYMNVVLQILWYLFIIKPY